jgi:TP901 family phage tail tape measure protein
MARSIASLIVRIGADDKEVTAALAKVGVSARATDAELKKIGDADLAKKASASFAELQKNLAAVTKGHEDLANRSALLSRGLEAAGGATKLTSRELAKLHTELRDGLSAFDALGKRGTEAAKDVEKAFAGLSKRLGKGLDLDKLTSGLRTAVTGLTVGVTAPILAIGAAALKSSISFEQGFASVKRTVDGTVDSLGRLTPEGKKLERAFLDLSLTVPKSVEELLKIGALAGQLDVPRDRVIDFTNVIARLGVTTSLSTEEAATSIAKIQNVFGSAGVDTDRFASTLLKLGVNAAASESEILELTRRLAPAAVQVRLTQGQTLALATALSNVGVQAEAGGTSLSNVFERLSSVVSKGGADLDKFAKVAEVSGEKFAKTFRVDAAQALVLFVQGLGKIQATGGDVFQTLKNLELADERVQRSLLGLASSSDGLVKALETQALEWASNTELARASGIQFETNQAQLTLLKNSANAVAKEFGDALVPAMDDLIVVAKTVVTILGDMVRSFDGLPKPIKDAFIATASFVALIGPAALALAGFASTVKSLGTIFAAFRIGAAATAISTWLSGVAAAGGATGVLAGAVAAAGPIVLGVGAAVALGAGAWKVYQTVTAASAVSANKLAEELRKLKIAQEQTALKNAIGSNLQDVLKSGSIEQIDALVQRLSRGGQLTGDAMRFLAAGLQRLKDEGKALTPALENILTAMSRQPETAKKSADGFDRLGQSVANVKAELAKLSSSQRVSLKGAIDAGFSTERIRAELGLSEEAINLFKKNLSESAGAVKKKQKALDELAKSTQALTSEEAALVRSGLKLGNTIEEVAAARGVAASQIRQLIEFDKELIKIQKIEAGTGENLTQVFKKLGTAARESFDPQIAGAVAKVFDVERAETFASSTEKIQGNLKGLGRTFNALTADQQRQIDQHAKMRAGLKDLSEAFSILSQSAGGGLSVAAREIGSIISSVSLAIEAMEQFNDSQLRGTQRAAGLAAAIGAVAQATSSSNAGAAALGGAVLGGAVGKKLGNVFGVQVSQAIGGTIGAVVGAAVGLFRALHKSQAEKVAHDVGRDLGVQISEGLAKEIANASKTIGRGPATLLSLDKIIGEAGGVKAFGIDQAISKTRDLFSVLSTGQVTAQQVGTAFDSLFGIILPEAIDKATGLAKASFTELVQLARNTEIESPQVNDFIGAQLKTNVGGGLNTFFAASTEAVKKQKELQDQLKDLRDQSTKATGDEQRRLADEIGRVTAQLATQSGVLKATTVTSQASATGFAAAIVATFADLQRIGVPVQEAIQAIGPSVTALRDQMQAAGLEGSAAFDRLLGIVSLAGDEIAGPVVTAVNGIGQALAGLSNAGGLIDQDIFTGLTNQVTEALASLESQGKGGEAALRLVQPALQTIFELQQRYRFAVDEGTAALLDQAQQAGVVGDQFKDAGERTAEALGRTNVILEAIANKLGAVLPAAAQTAATAISAAMGGIVTPEVPPIVDPTTQIPAAQSAVDGVTSQLSRITLDPTNAELSELLDRIKTQIPIDGLKAGTQLEERLKEALRSGEYQALLDLLGGSIVDSLTAAGKQAAENVTDELSRIVSKVRVDLQIRNDFPTDRPQNPVVPDVARTGGLVTAAGIRRFAAGGPVDFSPRGSDTVPALLTPGEVVLNARQQHATNAVLGQIGFRLKDFFSSSPPVSRRGLQVFAEGGRVLPMGSSVGASARATGAFTRSEAAQFSSSSIINLTVQNDIKAWDGASVRDAVLRPGGVTDLILNALATDDRGRGTVAARVVRQHGG